MVAARDVAPHQAGALEDADVLRHRVERDRERRRDLGDPSLAARKPRQDAAAGLVRERDEGVVEVHGTILTHMGE